MGFQLNYTTNQEIYEYNEAIHEPQYGACKKRLKAAKREWDIL